MLIKWIHFAVLIPTILMVTAKRLKDVGFEELSSESDAEMTAPCGDGVCPASKKKQSLQKEYSKPNVFEVLRLLSLLTNISNKRDTKMYIDVRYVQSGFKNGGRKYHVGNIHKTNTREKRDVHSVADESSTTEKPLNDVQTNDKVPLNVTEKTHKNNGSDDVNKQTAEENIFQNDATNIHVSVVRKTAPASLVKGREVQNDSNSFDIPVDGIPAKSSEYAFKLNVTSVTKDKINLEKASQPKSEIKVPVSRKPLSNIQNILSEKGVANFSLNVDADNNTVIVLVCNCNCGSKESLNNHTHDNSNNNKAISNASNQNNTKLLHNGSSLSNDRVALSSALTDVSSEKKHDAEKTANKTANNARTAELKKELSQMYDYLLLLHLKIKDGIKSGELSKDRISTIAKVVTSKPLASTVKNATRFNPLNFYLD